MKIKYSITNEDEISNISSNRLQRTNNDSNNIKAPLHYHNKDRTNLSQNLSIEEIYEINLNEKSY